MYYVPDGTKECGYYECKKCGNRFLSMQTMKRIPCPDCEAEIDYEIGPDESLESFKKMRKYYGEDAVCPVYVQVEDGERLSRALNREREQENPRYEEMCRRFIADQSDFSEENILNAGIEKRFQNINLDDCVKEIANYIKSVQ